MCGITGWVSFDRDLTRHQADLDAMTMTMACRGPDAEGSWLDQHVALRHRRLAVIDVEDIVAHELVADVPRCMLLSGGLGSSVLTALADPAVRRAVATARDLPGQHR